MDEALIKEVARQLRRPDGEFGREVGLNMNRGNAQVNRQAIEAMAVQPRMHVLEIGMGNGMFVGEILDQADHVRYTGCDYSPTMVGEARTLNRRHVEAFSAEFHEAQAHALPLSDASVDRVLTVNTVYFWDEPAAVFAELRRVMRPEARLVVGIRSRSAMETLPFVRHGFRLFSRDELSRYLEQHGFDVLETREAKEPEYYRDGELVAMDNVIAVAAPRR